MALPRGNVVDAGVVVLRVVPREISVKIIGSFLPVKEAAGIRWRGFDSAKD